MHFFEAIRLALTQIRAQKLKSFFTLLGVTIGVMFLIAVVSIVEGMSRYMENDFVGRLMGINTFEAPSSEHQHRQRHRRRVARLAAATADQGLRYRTDHVGPPGRHAMGNREQ